MIQYTKILKPAGVCTVMVIKTVHNTDPSIYNILMADSVRKFLFESSKCFFYYFDLVVTNSKIIEDKF